MRCSDTRVDTRTLFCKPRHNTRALRSSRFDEKATTFKPISFFLRITISRNRQPRLSRTTDLLYPCRTASFFFVRHQNRSMTLQYVRSRARSLSYPPTLTRDSWSEDAGGGEVTHGLGLIGMSFGLATCIGPPLGGSLSEFHRSTACVLSAGTMYLAVLSLRFYGWKETAPRRRVNQATDEASGGRGSAYRVVNPFAILKIFRGSR